MLRRIPCFCPVKVSHLCYLTGQHSTDVQESFHHYHARYNRHIFISTVIHIKKMSHCKENSSSSLVTGSPLCLSINFCISPMTRSRLAGNVPRPLTTMNVSHCLLYSSNCLLHLSSAPASRLSISLTSFLAARKSSFSTLHCTFLLPCPQDCVLHPQETHNHPSHHCQNTA